MNHSRFGCKWSFLKMGERENRSVTSKKANSVGTLLPDVRKFLHASNKWNTISKNRGLTIVFFSIINHSYWSYISDCCVATGHSKAAVPQPPRTGLCNRSRHISCLAHLMWEKITTVTAHVSRNWRWDWNHNSVNRNNDASALPVQTNTKIIRQSQGLESTCETLAHLLCHKCQRWPQK